MMKLQIFGVVLVVVSGLSGLNGAIADPLAPNSAGSTFSPMTDPLDAANCYMVTAEGATIDLSAICGSNVDRNTSPTLATAVPGNENAGTAFSQNGCFIFDSQGRPCGTVEN